MSLDYPIYIITTKDQQYLVAVDQGDYLATPEGFYICEVFCTNCYDEAKKAKLIYKKKFTNEELIISCAVCYQDSSEFIITNCYF